MIVTLLKVFVYFPTFGLLRAFFRVMKLSFCIPLITLAALTINAGAQTQTGDGHKLTPSEVKALAKGASTPEDHRKLAEYFRQEATDESAAAKLHDEMAEMYQPGSTPSKFKSPSTAQMKSHCTEYARNADKAAAAATKMAVDHEHMATMMSNAPAQGVSHAR